MTGAMVPVAVVQRLLDALGKRYGGTATGDTWSLHWRPEDFDELLAAAKAAESAASGKELS